MKRGVLFGIVFALGIQTAASVHVRWLNLWNTYLERNCESLLILFTDGECAVVTENLDYRVSFGWDYLFAKHEISEAILVIHNHLTIGRWSLADKAIYHQLRGAGFRGAFLCRLGDGSVIRMED